MKKIFLLVVALVILLAITGTVSAANLVANGGFEDPGSFVDSFQTLTAGDGTLTPWSIDTNSIDLINSYWVPHSGSYSIDLAGNGPGTISQNIDVGTNQICSLSFWMAGNPDYSDTKTLDVHFGSNTRSFTFDQTGHTKENMGWEEKTASGLIASGPTQLRFVDTGTDPYGPAIDDISLECTGQTTVPEFPTLALPAAFIIGLIGAVLFIKSTKEH